MDKRLAKKIFVFFVLILILGIGGFFLWKNNQETPPEKWMEAKMSPIEDFIIKETPEGKLVENKKAGISFKIPTDWIIKEDPSSFYSPDTKFNEKRSDILETGCRIYIYVSYIRTNIDTLEKIVNENFLQLSSVIKLDQFQKIELSGQTALKNKYYVEGLKMSYISIDFPFKNNIYKIIFSSPIQESERCDEEFNKFLGSVSMGPN
ncbi:MAG: PsbP-related protein [Candidatus Nealsonbacteria bacterium]|nr:PsbP-related protein [Candidatus Nealsonbacteria bacterium]